MQIIITIRAY